MKGTYIVGTGATALGKFPGQSVKDLTRSAVFSALDDAGLQIGDIEAAWFSNTRQGLLEGQNGIRGQCALRSMGFAGIPIVNIENACASGSTALREALAHIRAGMCDVALVTGAEKMFYPEKREAMFKAFMGGTDIHQLEQLRREIHAPQHTDSGSVNVTTRSIFMDIYAYTARLHMQQFGTTERQIAHAAAKNHFHSTFNPLSQYQTDMSVDQVLADKLICPPLTRAMCAPISDGAAAVILCSDAVLDKLGLRKRSIRVAGLSLKSGTQRPLEDFNRHIGRFAANEAYQEASIGPEEVSVAEVHDACAFAEILQIENLGFCAPGRGGELTEQGETTLGGRIPVNPSGGLVSKGHPVGATGILQWFELVTQLRGEAGRRQVANARVAVAENGGGFWGVEEAVTTVSVLVRD
ncbi:thiolase family protein [Haliea sp. E17]|uniref:thiolase family protein n=1 Tax=Haliea sp. E17 TaxID=3401576 RepID=UPI003AAD8943